MRRDSASRHGHYQELINEQQRGRALRHIQRDIKARRSLDGEDIRCLYSQDIETIKKAKNGDGHLRQLADAHERQRKREKGLER